MCRWRWRRRCWPCGAMACSMADKGGRPPESAWVAAALEAFKLLPAGVRPGTEVQALRQELGGAAAPPWQHSIEWLLIGPTS